jgi:hypothetical protein
MPSQPITAIDGVHNAFDDWYKGSEEQRDLAWGAFVAGVLWMRGRLVAAPPVTADTAALSPAGKANRTIIAALELFRDQVLPTATEEISSGEWCDAQEIETLIHQLREETP